VIVMLRHTRRAFVPQVDFITSVGFGQAGEGRTGHLGRGPTLVITDLGVLAPHPETNELRLVTVHPGIDVEEVREMTGWELDVSPDLSVGDPPTADELDILRQLIARTREAHSR
jgi:glutaconate CoA-transferase subunit B